MKPTCTACGQEFIISEREKAFCQEHKICLPTRCPLDRMRQSSAFLSSHYLYESSCDYSHKQLLTFVPPDTGYKVYDIDIWMSDLWDPLAYGQTYDSSRSFFDQFVELQRKVPLPSLECIRSTMENSDYTNGCGYVKNCYLLFGAYEVEDCYFSSFIVSSRDIVDCIYATKCELCYGCSYITNCYNCRFVENSHNCSDSTFLFNCRGLKNCYGCTNLNHKEYYFYNQPLSKQEYQKKVAAIDLGSFEVLEQEKAMFARAKQEAPLSSVQGGSNESSTGNYINNTKNCINCFFSTDIEAVEWGIGLINKATDCYMNNSFGNNASQIYYSAGCGENAFNIKFSLNCFSNVRDLEYCMFTGYGSENCFGCTGLRKKQYCILNKQYTREAYFGLVEKIKDKMLRDGEYGQFFPQQMSHLYYNHSWAQDLFPRTKTEAQKHGYTWHEETKDTFAHHCVIPDHINNIEDTILDVSLYCGVSNKKFRILKQELAIYRKLHLPLPRKAPIQRIHEMSKLFTIEASHQIQCSNCTQTIDSVYTPTNTQKVLCEACYQQFVSNL
ncbi:hypothetical protein KBB08_00225 [Candidatus Gracilibacteria bacterium]|nr:hypothetical protein [Candidatus Gracilibacteria bacterium]